MNVINKIKAAAKLCRIYLTFLCVSFSITAAFISSEGIPDIKKAVCVFAASLCGYMAGNALNGITDIKIDSVNPRTDKRPLVQGEISIAESFALIILLALAVVIFTWLIDFKYVLLLPIPMALCVLYSFSKRFTWLCHVILGTVEAVPAAGSWIVQNGWNDYRFIIMGTAVFFWIVGFELIYSSQDAEYDRMTGMKSIPAVFGISAAYKISLFSHIVMAFLFFVLMYICKTGVIFAAGVLIGLVITVYEHMLVSGGKSCKADNILNLNQIFGLILMLSAILDKIIL